ncbi:flagellar-associated protein FlgQ [Campylobacter pinnipediorum subsp. caledonicus]|uniref:hypothetical protein n=1 Tax=Campylobacter pinnipediorum TaxID=1965231 RepID=UPI00099530FA|nr:hypothetical protein [Campylobacter pinnipediorum]AQW86044.1 flagellar-associated protein FlgQ [Campylobacter pinnipediorum subsp. caledonicus]
MARNFCLLILVSYILFGSEDFIFWADLNFKNNTTYSENFNISKPMVKRYGNLKFLCEINNSKDKDTKTIDYLNLNKDKLFECFSSNKTFIKSTSKKYGLNFLNETKLTINPIYFTIDFKSNSAIIFIIESE